MAEKTEQFLYPLQEFVTLILKKEGIHEGIWGPAVTFAFSAGNAGPAQDQISPTAFVSVTSIGIQRFAELLSCCVDASSANPPAQRSEDA
jgi:hypothetical protein